MISFSPHARCAGFHPRTGRDLFVARATQKATDDGAVVGRAVGKLVVDERGGQQAFAFAAGTRNQSQA